MISDFSTRTRTDKAYRLHRDIDYLGKDEATEEGAWLSNYPKYSGVNSLVLNYPSGLPERIEFEAIGSLLAKTDYPLTDVRWPIMSKRMLDTLLSVGSFPHRAYPVVMLDIVEAYNPKLKKYVSPRTENHNYVAIHLTEYLDAFDFENSIYERDEDKPELILRTSVKWLALREPETGFPPLFTVKPASTKLFVSAEARAALESNDIQGIEFLHVEDGTIP
jgi:hypothetical protein